MIHAELEIYGFRGNELLRFSERKFCLYKTQHENKRLSIADNFKFCHEIGV